MWTSYLTALLLTLAIELPIVWYLGGAKFRGRLLADAPCANLLSHPCAWLAAGSWGVPWLGVEVGVVLVEAVVFALVTRMGWPRALAVSFAANAVSAGIGLLLYRAGLLPV